MSQTDPDRDVPCDQACDTLKTAIVSYDELMRRTTTYRFPPTKYDTMDDYDGISAQVHVVCEEAGEVASALRKETPLRIAEETWDLIHAAEGILRRLEANGVDVITVRAYVEDKNRSRGLYECEVAS